jgi:alpha-beta hydrolase superfamily lysophospholipase
MPFFAARGWACHALSLRGHGDSAGRLDLRLHSGADYARDVARIVATMPAPPVIVAHSMGGYVAQRYLLADAPPLAGLALLSSVPHIGSVTLLLRMLQFAPLGVLRALGTLSFIHLVRTPARARHWFFSDDLPADELDGIVSRLQDESFRILLDTLALRLPAPARVHALHADLPILVLGAADDHVFSAGEMRRLARAYGADLMLLPGLAHDVMLDTRWQHAANALWLWLRSRFA